MIDGFSRGPREGVLGLRNHVSVFDVLTLASLAAFGAVWAVAASGAASPGCFMFWLAVPCVAVMVGRCLLIALSLEDLIGRSFPFTALAGFTGLGAILTVGKLASSVAIDWLFILVSVVVCVLYFRWWRRISPWRAARRETRYAFAATLIAALAATIWIQPICPFLEPTPTRVIYRPYHEYLYHAMRAHPLAADGNPRTIGSYQLSGEPLPMYQYASYSFPALASRWAPGGTWTTIVSVWVPLGLVWLGWGAYCLGATLGSPRSGFWASVAVCLVPDLCLLLPGYRFEMLSFHRFLEASPALAYGCGVGLLVVSLLLRGILAARRAAVLLAFVLMLTCLLFKANVFLVLFPLFGLVLLFQPGRLDFADRRAFVAVWLALGMLGFVASRFVSNAPTIGMGTDLGAGLFKTIQFEASNANPAFMDRLAADPSIAALFERAFFLIAYVLGPFIVVASAAWLVRPRRGKVRGIVFPLAVTAIFLFISLGLAPNTNGDPYELAHRHFVWFYAAIVAWSAAVVARRLVVRRYSLAIDAIVVSVMLVAPCLIVARLTTSNVPMPHGLVECCTFVRESAAAADIVVDETCDPLWIIGAQVQRPMFVCTSLEETFPGYARLRGVIAKRREIVARGLQCETAADLRNWIDQTGVRWFILGPDASPAWPPEILSAPAYQSSQCRVFDLSALNRRQPDGL